MSSNAKTVASKAIAPTQSVERNQTIDILRGFALFGILLVNMELFAHPPQLVVMPREAASAIDSAAAWLVRFVAEGKFYSLFSLLFGLGFALQMTRAEDKGARFAPLYLRRLVILLGIGLIHAFFISVGDILAAYALLGFALLLFRKAKPKTLLIWAVILLTLPILFYALGVGAIELGRSAGPEIAAEIDRSFAEQRAAYLTEIERAYRVYADGNFAEITAQRAQDMLFRGLGSLFLAPSIFAMFLIGLWFARRGLFQNIEANLPFFRRLLWWGLAVGVVGNFIYASLMGPSLPRFIPTPTLLIATLGQTVGAPALCLFYVAALTLLARQPAWQQRLRPLALTGRMALSNYLGQSIICTLIFYGYGLGLFGQVGKAPGLLLVVVIYTAQVLISAWWMQRFQFGPAEWLWRTLTYMKPQPMRKAVVAQ